MNHLSVEAVARHRPRQSRVDGEWWRRQRGLRVRWAAREAADDPEERQTLRDRQGEEAKDESQAQQQEGHRHGCGVAVAGKGPRPAVLQKRNGIGNLYLFIDRPGTGRRRHAKEGGRGGGGGGSWQGQAALASASASTSACSQTQGNKSRRRRRAERQAVEDAGAFPWGGVDPPDRRTNTVEGINKYFRRPPLKFTLSRLRDIATILQDQYFKSN